MKIPRLIFAIIFTAAIQNVFCQAQSLEIMSKKEPLWRFEGKGQWEIKKNTLKIVENSITRDPFTAPSVEPKQSLLTMRIKRLNLRLATTWYTSAPMREVLNF